ncbi:MAG: MFS transporter [Firmicutes bacterium]|nr:MFS transporter [Bacillota bacterium]
MTKTSSDKLSIGTKCGYGFAAIGDAMGYTLPGTYLLFFLTTVAGIQPAMAGTITVIAAVWNALLNPIAGYISDHFVSRFGRRRPFMFVSTFPLIGAIILLFTAVELTDTLKTIYYCLVAMAFWTAFTSFFIPFYALGAEYTENYDERTSLRSFASIFNIIGTLLGMAMPPIVVDELERQGFETDTSWTITAALVGVITGASILVTVLSSKDYDINVYSKDESNNGKISIKGLCRDYVSILKLKPTKYILIACLCSLIAYTMIMSDFVYYLTYKVGLTGTQISIAMAFRCCVGICLIPLALNLCKKSDNRTAMITIFMVASVCMVMERFIGVYGLFTLGLFIIITCFATGLYWQIMPAIVYELCAYDEYETGMKREGSVVSVQGLVEGIAEGLGAQILGIILQIAGFDGDAAVQSDTTMRWIVNCTTWVPVILLVISIIALYKYPITRQKFKAIQTLLDERKNSEHK